MCHQWFTGIGKTWRKLGNVILIGLVIGTPFLSVKADEWKWQDGVIVQKIGSGFVFVFPSSQGRIMATAKQSGKIKIGKTITILYALQIEKSKNARYVALDGSKLSTTTELKPELKVEGKDDVLGFVVQDTSQDVLNIYINSSFTKTIGKIAQDKLNRIQKEKIARQGNLNVVVSSKDKVNYKIDRVEINY